MKRIRGLIYDCDGVLFESRKANLAYYNAVLSEFNEPPVKESDHQKAHLCHTAASADVLHQLLGKERVTKAMAVAERLDYREFIPFMQPQPGMTEAISTLSKSFPLAIATNRGYSMPSILKHFGLTEYFQVIVTSRDVLQPKPAPDMLHVAAKNLLMAPDEILFIGDSELDQAAAKAAGMRFAIYRGRLQADIQLDHHDELVALLKGLPSQSGCTTRPSQNENWELQT